MDFHWLSHIDPIWSVATVIVGYLGLFVWTVTRSADFVFEGAPDRRRWRDLRLWIAPLILVQIALHLVLR